MKKFSSFIIRQKIAVLLTVAFVLGFGIFSTLNMPVNLLPDINVPMVCVQVIYPGANAQSVEEDVTVNVEDGLSAMGGVTSVTSYSYDNLSAVILSFDYGADTGAKKNDIAGRLQALGLPDGVVTSVYDIDLNADALAVLSVTSDKGESESERLLNAQKAARSLSEKISAAEGVERVEIKGGADYYYSVTPAGGLELLSPLMVQAFSYGALDIPLGNVTENGAEVQIRNNSDITSEDDIKNMPLELPSAAADILRTVKDKLSAFLSGGQTDIGELCENAAAVRAGLSAVDTTEPRMLEIGLTVDERLKQLSQEGVREIISKKREAENAGEVYYITDEDCVKLFTGTAFAERFPQLLDAETVGFLRSYPLSEKLIEFALNADIPQSGGFICAVKDVAAVNLCENFTSYVYSSGGGLSLVKGTVLEIYKANGANSSAVVQSVKEIYGEFLSGDGRNYSAAARLLDDQSEFISDSVTNVLVSMLIGGALAVLVIFLFLKKAGLSLIIAVTMPLSVLAALICLSLMGITLNMVSLGGLAVGIGMLVDNSIVVIECISKHRDMDKSAAQAAVDGAAEVGGALLASTLTTVCVFIPIIFTGGLTAEIFTDLSWAVIFSLAFSLIVAVTVIPTLYAAFCGKRGMLKGGKLSKPAEAESAQPAPVKEKNKLQKACERFKEPVIMNKISGAYSKILPAVLGKKAVTIITAAAVFAASCCLLLLTGTEFLPSIDKGQIEINLNYGSAARLEEIESDVADFARKINENVDDIDYLSVSVGKNGLLALTDTGIITVQLNSNRNTDRAVERIRELSQNATGRITVKKVDGVVASITSGMNDMSVSVVGDDMNVLKAISAEIEYELSQKGFYYVGSTATQTAREYDLKFDRRKMAEYGLDYQTIVMTLRIGMASHTACSVTVDGQSYNVNVSFGEGAVADISQLRNFIVGVNGGNAVRLSDVCEIRKINIEPSITRVDGKRMISVTASKNTDTGSASREMQAIAAAVLENYEGYTFETGGVSSYLNDAFSGLAVALVISFFLLYAVMAVQFSSALQPLIVMASIPFSFTGGFIALVITGTSLNVVSFIGLIMLMGVVVNNAIVMLEKIKQLRREGMQAYDAVTNACRTRLRPILMTTLTTVLALIPMAVGVGRGSELMQPLGIVVIGGLLLGTLVTLILVPAVYCAVNRISAGK